MDFKMEEQTVIFISIVKWVVLSAVIGALVGLSSTIFLKVLYFTSSVTEKIPFYFFFLPVVLFINISLVKNFAPEAAGHGTEKVIEAVHKRSGKVDIMVVPIKLVTTVMTIAFGGSSGREGPCAQIGSGLSSFFADVFRFDDKDRKKLVICGVSAAFASVFGTPISGAIFGVEILFVGAILYDVLLPSVIAGITSYHISAAFGITHGKPPALVAPVFSEYFLAKIVIAGIFFGLCSVLLITIIRIGDRLSGKFNTRSPLKGVVGGIIVVVLALVFTPRYLGLGSGVVDAVIKGESVQWYDFILKPIFTAFTLGFGGSGGVLATIFFMGATAGSFLASVMQLDSATFAAIGLVSVLGGAANAPLAASIMSIELFGPQIGSFAAISCVISFLMTGHRSVYPTQILWTRKSPGLETDVGKELSSFEQMKKPWEKDFADEMIETLERTLKDLRRKKEADKYHEKTLKDDDDK